MGLIPETVIGVSILVRLFYYSLNQKIKQMTNTKVIVLNANVISRASDIEQLLVLSFMKDINKNLLSIQKAKAEIYAILYQYAEGNEVFDEVSANN